MPLFWILVMANSSDLPANLLVVNIAANPISYSLFQAVVGAQQDLSTGPLSVTVKHLLSTQLSRLSALWFFSGCFITIANYETLQYIPISSRIYPPCLLFKRCLALASLVFLKKINQCNSVSQSNNPVQSTVSELFFSLSHSSGFAMILLLRLSRWQAIFY